MRVLFIFGLLLLSFPSLAAYKSSSETEKSQQISIAFTFSMPPYLYADLDRGIERDIIAAALKAGDLTLGSIHNVHYKRAIDLFQKGEIEGIVSNTGNYTYEQSGATFYASNKTIDYIDCSISLARKNLDLNNIDAYSGKTIWAFKTAKQTLGSRFEKMANNNPYYSEDVDQSKQAEMLLFERIDIAISDRNIFAHKLKASDNYSIQDFSFHPITQATARTVRLNSKQNLERFNEGLAIIKNNGSYDKIIAKYQNEYFSACF